MCGRTYEDVSETGRKIIMGKIYIDHIYICSSFFEAKALAKQFSEFKVVFRSLGVKRTIHPKTYIRKRSGKSNYSHILSIRYKFDFAGEFAEYGFIDKRTLLKHPDLPTSLLEIEDKFDRWETFFERTSADDENMYDPEYYEDFERYFKKELKDLIDKLYLTEVIALPHSRSGGLYTIYYEECGKVYEMNYGAEKGRFSFVRSLDSLRKLETLDFQKTWDWINKHRKYQKDEWHTEVRPLTALSYAINREPFEQFFYAILGLESVYTNGNRRSTIKEQLKTMLPRVFTNVSADDVEKLYSLRSDFVHGNITFPNYYDSKTPSFVKYDYIQYANEADFLLLRTIQLLVKNNAYKARNDGAGGIVFVGE